MYNYPMFNNKGESQMYLIIERIEYDSIDHTFNIAQNTESKSKAEEYKKALETLHADDDNKKSFTIVEVA